MGSIIRAECRCGVDVQTAVGGGMMNFRTTCYFPCYCESCRSLQEVNILLAALRCPSCAHSPVVPYDDPALLVLPGQNIIEKWSVARPNGSKGAILTDGHYRCPRCGEGTLKFRRIGFSD